MAHHAPLPGSSGASAAGSSGASESVRGVPPVIRSARDELFEDADRHGPRAGELIRRIAPALLLLPAALILTMIETWRRMVLHAVPHDTADLMLVTPFVIALIVLASMLAPLARSRTLPVIGSGVVLLGLGGWLVVEHGQVAWASVPSSIGALLVGIAASRVVRRVVWALPLLLAAGVSDVHSVAYGVTGKLLGEEGAAGAASIVATTELSVQAVQRVDLLVLHVPVLTGTWLLGIVDVVAIGLLIGLAHLYWLPLTRTAVAMGVAIAAAMSLGGAVPVLPLLGLAWLLANARLVWRATRFSLRRLTYLGG